MKTKRCRKNFFSNSGGSTFVSSMIAAGIIVVAVLGVGASSLRMSRALKKAEVGNLAVSVEANLVAAFQDKRNYPDPISSKSSPNAALRSGTLTMLPLKVSFVEGGPTTINVPVSMTGAPASDHYLDTNLAPCAAATGFSAKCVIRYNVGLKKITSAGISYAFSYVVEANPAVVSMAALGNIKDFGIPLEPGNYRAEINLTNCDKDSSLFVTGVNRDTGEVFCAKKPAVTTCPKDTLAKGLKYVPYGAQPPAIELNCTSKEMRVFKCPANYALQKFNPQYIDPDNTAYNKAPGTCVFLGANSSVSPGNFPPNPTSPYMKTVAGTFCPPFYKSNQTSACTLVPDTAKNSNPSLGLGRCAPTKYKNCKRSSYTQTNDAGVAYAIWFKCINTYPQPTGGCGIAPANPVYTTTCYITQTSPDCDDVPTSSKTCETIGPWSAGTAYADTSASYWVQPEAAAIGTPNGRKYSCTFRDTSSPCTAPSTDYNGNTWGRKDPKWYGGVQVQGVTCSYDSSLGKPEVVDAI